MTHLPGSSQRRSPAYCRCHICLRNGFDSGTAVPARIPGRRSAYLLASARRHSATPDPFFRYTGGGRLRHRQPGRRARLMVGHSRRSRSRATSRARLHLPGHESGRGRTASSTEGAWPIICRAGRVSVNSRWGQTGRRARALPAWQRGAAMVVRLARHGPRSARRAASSIACSLTGTCPKIVEHFGGSEVFALEDDRRMGGNRPPMPTSR